MAVIDDLIAQISDEDLRRRIESEVAGLKKQKKFGLVFEEHLPECTPLYDLPIKVGTNVALKEKSIKETYVVLSIDDNIVKCINKITKEEKQFDINEIVRVAEFGEAVYPYLKPIDSICNAPDSDLWHTLIEADNYHALQYLEYLYAGKVDCIYIDPPYNSGAHDWKYNNDYVDEVDEYRHSKWLSFMEKRLILSKKLLNPNNSVLIVTIDEKEYLHLGCLLEDIFKGAKMQMISSVIKTGTSMRKYEFSRCNEYIFFVRLGDAVIEKEIPDDENASLPWRPLMRSGTGKNNFRPARPNSFYPIFINNQTNKVEKIGDSIPLNLHENDIVQIDGCTMLLPYNGKGQEMVWGASSETLKKYIKDGFARVKPSGKNGGYIVQYLTTGVIDDINNGNIIVEGRDEFGGIKGYYVEGKAQMPQNQWNIPSHNATLYGTNLLKDIIGQRFDFPKSVYAVYDCLMHLSVIKSNSNSLIIDFFAGSGTTLHAVNLINAHDNGNRRCVMVTNNEVSEDDERKLKSAGINRGTDEWDSLGIAKYVTWPRTKCSIDGKNINGISLNGDYLVADSAGNILKMSDGFKTNANFFKLSFLDKNLVRLGRQFKEMIPTLWMKSGAIGPCPVIENYNEPMYIFKENKMAVLVDEKEFNKFEYLVKNNDIKTVFFVTDYEPNYVAMANHFDGYDTYQLYRDYLDNFKINVRRG